MRKQLSVTSHALLDADPRLVVLLGDIGVFGFRGSFEKHPTRVYNIGILEPATVGMASGLAREGLIPLVHTIAPFLVERSYEQLKIDFGYQRLGGNFVSVGASYDYAALGCTHHCPGDVAVLRQIPHMEIVVPGTAQELDSLLRKGYANGNPTYYRLSERSNAKSHAESFGSAVVVKRGGRGTVLAVGPMLEPVLAATEGLDVTVLYYTTIRPFDGEALRACMNTDRLTIVEPFYQGSFLHEVTSALGPRPVAIQCIGVPAEFLTRYGRAADHDEALGLTPRHIREKVLAFIQG